MNNMQNVAAYIAAGALAICVCACGNGTPDAKKEADSTNNAMVDSAKKVDTAAAPAAENHTAQIKDDAAFAVDVADAGQLEIDLGKMAQQKGVNPKVKALGAMMVADHSKAGKELKGIAAKENITLPAALSDKCQKKKDDLSAKTGADFDKAYTDGMVEGHKSVVDDMKNEISNGKDSALVKFARMTLPKIEHHLHMAEEAKAAVDK